MLLELFMPRIDRLITDGSILRWLKKEGEWVNYGDDLFDVMAQINVKRVGGSVSGLLKNLADGKVVTVDDLLMEDVQQKPVSRFRVTASDFGCLKRICVPEGAPCKVGDLVALLSTDNHETIDDAKRSGVTMFRVVSSPIGELTDG